MKKIRDENRNAEFAEFYMIMCKFIKFFMLLLVFVFLSSCTEVSVVSVSGKVVDTETGEPIKDVLIYAEWKSYHRGFEHSWTDCEKVEILRTDSDGKYGFVGVNATVGFLENTPYIDEGMLLIYKKGYRPEKLSGHSGDGRIWIEDIKNKQIKLVPDRKTHRNRMNYLNTLVSGSPCMQSYKVKHKYKTISKEYISSIYSEFYKYVYTKDDIRGAVSNYCLRIAELEPENFSLKNKTPIVLDGFKKISEDAYKYISEKMPECRLEHLQEIRRNNIYSLLTYKDAKYEGGSVSACVDKVNVYGDKTVMTVTGGGLFSLSSPDYLGDKSVPIYFDLSDFDLVFREKSKKAKPYLSCMGRVSRAGSSRLIGGARVHDPDLKQLNTSCESTTRELTVMAYKEKEKNGFSDEFFRIQKKIEKIRNSVSTAVEDRYRVAYKTEFSAGDPVDVRFAKVDIETGIDNKPIRMTVLKTNDHSIRKGWENKMIDRKAEYEETIIPVELHIDRNKPQIMGWWVNKLKSCGS